MKMADYNELHNSSQSDPKLISTLQNKDQEMSFSRNQGLSTREALIKLHDDMEQEILRMKVRLHFVNFRIIA